MMEWKEYYKVPNVESTHVQEGYENTCENCQNWGEACETCDVSVPLVTDEYKILEKTMSQMTICGVPVGNPHVIDEKVICMLKN